MTRSTLVIILNQDRDLDITFSNLQTNLLSPLNADLAFCGSWSRERSDTLRSQFTYDWSGDEPTDWIHAIDEISVSDWRRLIPFGEQYGSHFLGPTIEGATTGSGVIGHYWRFQLQQIISEDIRNRYDWFVITRSDWFWTVPHPNVDKLDKDKIFILSGESYGGLNDRHLIIPSKHINEVLKIPNYIFKESDKTVQALDRLGLEDLNCERFYKFCLDQLGLTDHLVFIPYLGYLVRNKNSQTRWSSGQFSKKLNLFVKYPLELSMSRSTFLYFKRGGSWTQIFSKIVSIENIYEGQLGIFNKLFKVSQDFIKYKNVRVRFIKKICQWMTRIIFGIRKS